MSDDDKNNEQDEGKKEVEVRGSADVSGAAEGKLEFEARAGFTPGEKEPEGPSGAEVLSDVKGLVTSFSEGLDALMAKYEVATQDAARDTAKATASVPAAFSRSGAVD